MSKIIIELTNDNKTIITYDNGKIVYPICDVNYKNFHISEITNIDAITLVAGVIYRFGTTLMYQLDKQGFLNKTLNKLVNGK